MAKLLLDLGSEVGEKTCIREKLNENCCPMLRVRKLGQVWWCHQFEKDLVDPDGWLQRLPECLRAEIDILE